METVSTARTRIERDFDPEAVQQAKAAAGRDLTVAGRTLAAPAFEAGLVDELHLFVTPVVGGGKPSLPGDVRLQLELLAERRFRNGAVYTTSPPRREGGDFRLLGTMEPVSTTGGARSVIRMEPASLKTAAPPQSRSYSSRRRNQIPFSFRPSGARSSHWYMPHNASRPRA